MKTKGKYNNLSKITGILSEQMVEVHCIDPGFTFKQTPYRVSILIFSLEYLVKNAI